MDQPSTYVRKAMVVHAMQLSADNVTEVAAWCHGFADPFGTGDVAVMSVHLPGVATQGTWVVHQDGSWLIVNDDKFRFNYQLGAEGYRRLMDSPASCSTDG